MRVRNSRWLVAALAVVGALLVLAARGRPSALAPPGRCGGLLDLLSVAAFRLAPGLETGPWLHGLHALALATAIVVVATVSARLSGSVPAGVGLGIATGFGALFPWRFAPPVVPAVFAVCTWLWSAAARGGTAGGTTRPGRRGTWGGIAGSALLGALVPALLPLAALVAAAFAVQTPAARHGPGRRVAAANAAVLLVSVATVVPATLLPPLPRDTALSVADAVRCAVPGPEARGWWRDSWAAVSAGAALGGPLLLGLAALGAFGAWPGRGNDGEARRLRRRIGPGAAWTVLALAVVGLAARAPAGDSLVVLPAVSGAWLLAARGVRELLGATSSPRRRLVAAVVLLCLFPLLQLSRAWTARRDDQVAVMGHERLSARGLQRRLGPVPSGAVLVEEDASIDLLLRASAAALARTGKLLRIAPLDADLGAAAQEGTPVFALPAAQGTLRDRGVAFETEPGTRPSGLARVRSVAPCLDVGAAWVDATSVFRASPRAALVSGASVPPATALEIFLGSDAGLRVTPEGWPPRAVRGFHVSGWERALAGLDAGGGPPAGSTVLDAPHLTRLTLWRTPGAPLALPVRVAGAVVSAVARVRPVPDGPAALALCPSPGGEIEPIR